MTIKRKRDSFVGGFDKLNHRLGMTKQQKTRQANLEARLSNYTLSIINYSLFSFDTLKVNWS